MGGILNGKTRYTIPDYQRRYIWPSESVEILYEDLVLDYDESGEGYLLGPIVTKQVSPRCKEIIDGQQRLISMTLLFCTLRDCVVEKHPPPPDGRATFEKFIKSINIAIQDDKGEPLIELNNRKAREIFKKICASSDWKQKKLKHRLFSNYFELFSSVEELCSKRFKESKTYGDGITAIRELFDRLKAYTYFISVMIQHDDYTFPVFQSLNSKGQPLHQSDLIKSHLLSIANKNGKKFYDEVIGKWDQITNLPEKESKKIDELLYHTALSRECEDKTSAKEIRKNDMYKSTKYIKTPNQINDYLENLEEDAEIYKKIANPAALKTTIDRYAHILYGADQIGARYFKRAIIATHRKKIDSDAVKLLDCLVKFFFVYRTICKKDIDLLKSIAHTVTCKINQKKDLGEILCSILINDKGRQNVGYDEFAKKIRERTDNLTNNVLKYILYSIEYKLQEPRPVKNTPNLELEHILPQKPDKKDWHNAPKPDEYKNDLGNVTLIKEKFNKDIKNHGFIRKRDDVKSGYKASKLEINRLYLNNYNTWDVKQIEERRENLCKKAEEIWDLSEYTKMAEAYKEKSKRG
ncbi:conserved hypothetical protein [Cenarchaeum symbiosum A]|uniref:DUF262 domain-containing protein n=1 Tax=Cenarchaeum symbiosum (strain A) TaxID=414004 RepID=A0RVA9_CENSY|nr:conserved hypothetical protein [Cenarchaeum symbiosum A]